MDFDVRHIFIYFIYYVCMTMLLVVFAAGNKRKLQNVNTKNKKYKK